MDYDAILQKCNYLLSSNNLDEISDFIPELMRVYDLLDIEATKASDGYDNLRDMTYIQMSREKNDTKKTDKMIETESKARAAEKFWNRNINKVVVKHFEKYLHLLEWRQIKLMSDRKQDL